jgi:hypothetical protein
MRDEAKPFLFDRVSIPGTDASNRMIRIVRQAA